MFSENDLARAIEHVAETDDLENDLSPMIEPALDAEDAKTVVSSLKTRKGQVERRLRNMRSINRLVR